MSEAEVVNKWTALWRGDGSPDQLYREDAIYWAIEDAPELSRVGRNAPQARVTNFHSNVEDVTVDVYRTFGTNTEYVIEAIIAGVDRDDQSVRRGTGVCAILDLDRNGQVTREQLHMQWRGRRADDGLLRPFTPEQDGYDRGRAFWHDFAERQLTPWSSPDPDPDQMVDQVYAEEGYILDGMIAKEPTRLVGREALREAEHRLLARLPIRETYIARLIHDGNAAAVWHPVVARAAADSPARSYSSLMILTVDRSGRCISEHTYLPAAWPAGPLA